jgi:hypothetical protein
MATSANLPEGAVAANGLESDPFTISPSNPPHHGPTRYASFDNDQFSTYSTNSPSQARRALEAHLKDTDRRIQDASKLGTTLISQRKNLASRLKEVEELSKDNDVPQELQQRLTALEKEYNDIGRESARAFLPKVKPVPGDGAAVYSSSGRESPSKMSAPSRRQRNQPTNRVHDIEFATEISTQLLAQVRQLQSALAEKDEELKDAAAKKSQIEDEHTHLVQRAKQLDESLQRHRDENWNLETKLQDLEASMRELGDKEQRLNQTLKVTQTEKSTAQRDLDELKALHEKAIDEHAATQRQNEADLHTLRRDAANHDLEKRTLQKKIEEVTSQNTELAKAVSYRWNQGAQQAKAGVANKTDSDSLEDADTENPDLISPIKGTPARAGMLETETLKSSLNHAHRMIQNLKNNIHREKTEKVELKRMLAEARDEVEKRRDSNAGVTAANMSKKRSDATKARMKPIRVERLGANRNTTTEIIEDEPDWEEEHDEPNTPSRSLFMRPAPGAAAMPGAFQETDTSDAFETADERRGDTATETEAFQTGAESFGEDSDLTETEDNTANRLVATTSRTSRRSVTPSAPARPSMPGDRHSYLSTASASGGEEEGDVVRTPVQTQGPKYRLRVNRGARTSSGHTLNERLADSPASSMGTPQAVGQSLGDELDALEDDDDDESIEGTPNSQLSTSSHASPMTQRTRSVESKSRNLIGATEGESTAFIDSDDETVQTQNTIGSPFTSPVKSRKPASARESLISKPVMVDSGMMTEPWAPEKEIVVQRVAADADSDHDNNKTVAGAAVAGAAGGILAGTALGGLSSQDGDEKREQSIDVASSSSDETPAGLFTPSKRKARKDQLAGEELVMPLRADPVILQHSAVVSQETEPIAAPTPVEKTIPAIPLQKSMVFSQETEPVAAPAPVEKTVPAIPLQKSMVFSQETEPVAAPTPAKKAVPAIPLQQSTVFSQETEPVSPKAVVKTPTRTAFQQSAISSLDTEPVSPPRPFPKKDYETIAPISPVAKDTELFQNAKPQQLGFSPVSGQDFAPVRPLVPRRSSRRLDALYNEGARASAPPGLFGTDSPSFMEDRSRGLQFDDKERVQSPPSPIAEAQSPMGSALLHPAERERALSSDSMIPITKPLTVKRPMAESGSQTVVSGDEIERMMRDKRNILASVGVGAGAGAGVGAIAGAGAAGLAANNIRRSVDSGMSSTFQPRGSPPNDMSSLHVPRQSASVNSMRSTSLNAPPPLPADHDAKIAAAAQKAPPAMGPPMVPASAYKRPKTPVGGPSTSALGRPASRDSFAPRPAGRAPSALSRQASVSSFASELDERFNIHKGQFVYPDDLPPTTDPRMIQAITQTMIGEYLWKYTRKTGRNETSNSRHRRFFWVHPYTRTLYWSDRDPSNSGKDMMKAKSMSIEAVRVITDDNTSPPGLHRKSIVILTPGREIVVTAPTGQRHETWFNALSYLLLRTEQERTVADDTIDEEELGEFAPPNPGSFSFRRSVSRMTGRSAARSQVRRSLSSYHSRSRPSSPTKSQHDPATTTPRPPLNSTPTLTPTSHDNYGSTRGRLSSFTPKFRTGSQRGSFTSAVRPGAQSSLSHRSGRTEDTTVEGHSNIYNASVVDDSAEDLRAVIERQEGNADRLENVRACCDGKFQPYFPVSHDQNANSDVPPGKHDVGSLSRSQGRHASFTRSSVRGHSHGPPPASSIFAHAHGHPLRPEQTKDSQRSRRGE